MTKAFRSCTVNILFLFLFCGSSILFAATEDPFDMSLEELMKVEVTSVAKKPQRLRDISAAVHIISAEDIRRSGATCIPEALGLAPGVNVMTLSNNRWAVAIRGAAREYSNKLLVLVDGRSVYMPTFSGVMWEALDVPLENIQRIEVIRGPGASIWGANAVNGVINIITFSAADTQGGKLSLAAGNMLKNFAFLRYGYKQNQDTAVRFHARGFEYDQSQQINGQRGEDAWTSRSAGFRIDRGTGEDSQKFMLQGNAFLSRADDLLTMFSRPPAIEDVMYTQRKQGLDLSARWEFFSQSGRQRSVQSSFESAQLHHIFIDENRRTFDLEFTERFAFKKKHDIIWGAATRLSWDTVDGTKYMRVSERKRLSQLYRMFINDDIELQPEKLHLLLTAGLEHNNVTGVEFQPSIRLMATPDDRNSLWLAWSRSSRTPSRIESGSNYYGFASPAPPVPMVADIRLDDATSEKIDSIDMGWRRKLNERLNVDVSGFYFKYKDVFGSENTTMDFYPAGYMVFNQKLNNATKADVRGLEFSLDWFPHEKWKIQGVYSYININTAIPSYSTLADVGKNVPERTYSIFSKLQLAENLNWDLWYKHAGRNECGNKVPIPGYDLVDTQMTWKARHNLEFSFVVQNVFDKKHQEFLPEALFSRLREFGRRAYVKSEWSF